MSIEHTPVEQSDIEAGGDVAILVVSCDAYQDLWEPFFNCFFKYWPDCPYPIYLGSNFLQHEGSRVHPIHVGADVDYSSNLINMINQIRQGWIILWIEDRVLSAHLNTTRMSKLIKQVQDQHGVYLKLIANHPFSILNEPNQEFGEIPKYTKYRTCMTVALWHKQTLQRLLRAGETAWQFERNGSKRSNEMEDKFFSLSLRVKNNPPISDKHLVIKGRLIRDVTVFLKEEGVWNCLRNRQMQTFRSYLYLKLYVLFADLIFQFKKVVNNKQ